MSKIQADETYKFEITGTEAATVVRTTPYSVYGHDLIKLQEIHGDLTPAELVQKMLDTDKDAYGRITRALKTKDDQVVKVTTDKVTGTVVKRKNNRRA